MTEGPDRQVSLLRRLWNWLDFENEARWRWLELLSVSAIPIVLVVAGSGFTWWQGKQQDDIEEQRAQEEALQSYLDQMSTLLLDEGLGNSAERSVVQRLARARTLTVLGRLDRDRKTDVMLFLVEARLVQGEFVEEDLRNRLEAFPEGPVPEGDLTEAPKIDLAITDLSGVVLPGADLSIANLRDAVLSGANLTGADLFFADLGLANLSGADLSDADLRLAALGDANLRDADLSCTELSDDAPSCTDLTGADLTGADLTNAKGINKDKLEQQARSLEGATMPDGSKHP